MTDKIYQFTDAELDVVGVFDRQEMAGLLAEAERRGTEKGWDEGYRLGWVDGSRSPSVKPALNPYSTGEAPF